MGALACTALAKEHIAVTVKAHSCRMEECCGFIGCRQGKHHHHCIVDGHLCVLTGQDESALTIVVGADEPACRFVPPDKLVNGFMGGGLSADDLLSLFLLAQVLYITDCLALGDGEHEYRIIP